MLQAHICWYPEYTVTEVLGVAYDGKDLVTAAVGGFS